MCTAWRLARSAWWFSAMGIVCVSIGALDVPRKMRSWCALSRGRLPGMAPCAAQPSRGPRWCSGRLPTTRSSSRRKSLVAVQAAASQPAPVVSSSSSSSADEYFATDSRPVILFDGVCNLCNGGVNFMLDWDRRGSFRMAALQSPAGRKLLQRAGRSPDDISSIVLVEPGQAYIRSEAVLRIAQQLNMPLALLAGLAFLVPRPAADVLYDQVANNRYNLFGYAPSCRMSDPRFEERFLSD